jgi:Ca2+-binding RTX toxin-like protein
MTGLGSVGDAAGDTLANIENLTGSNFDDVLEGNGSNNVLAGGAGNDILGSLDGNDTLLGAVGSDVLDGGVGNDIEDGGAAGSDTLLGFENLTGSAFSDKLMAQAWPSSWAGLAMMSSMVELVRHAPGRCGRRYP